MAKKMHKIVKILHQFFISLWVGGSICMVFLYWSINPVTENEIHVKYNALNIIDYALVIPGAMGNIFTGLYFGLKTKWGFFKHKWITIKWILNVGQIIFGTFFLGRWLYYNTLLINQNSINLLTESNFIRNENLAKSFSFLQVFLLLFVIWISVMKPKLNSLNREYKEELDL
jgi:lipoprotein signal peptidase